MRRALWPDASTASHRAEMKMWCNDPARYAAFLARSESGDTMGVAEVSVRTEYVNGTDTSPVGFLEGIYVDPAFRCQGVARALVEAAATWAASAGCQEFASDTEIENSVSRGMHRALGFEETEQVVFFLKRLG